jgi:hypothetical protein
VQFLKIKTMKKIVTFLSCALLLPLTGCLDESSEGGNRTVFQVDQTARKPQSSRYGFGSAEEEERRKAARSKPNEKKPEENLAETAVAENTADDTSNNASSTGTPEVSPPMEDVKTEEPKTTSTTTPSSSGAPVAQMIPGKAGQVYSPFAPGKPIDVSGYPPGTLMRCPYTAKEFKVP